MLLLVLHAMTPGMMPGAAMLRTRVAPSSCIRMDGNPLFDALKETVSGLAESFNETPEQKNAKEDAKEREFQEQQAILRRRRNPNANAQYMKDAEERRAESSKAFQEKFAWQSDETQDPLIEFKRRQKEGKLNPIGCASAPKGNRAG